jgi:hypothetical protein
MWRERGGGGWWYDFDYFVRDSKMTLTVCFLDARYDDWLRCRIRVPKMGYKEIGVVPNYGFSPKDGKLVDEMFFYKDLRRS